MDNYQAKRELNMAEKLAAYDGRVIGAQLGGLTPVNKPLQDHASEIRTLQSQVQDLRMMINKLGEEFNSRITNLEMKVGN